MTDEDYKRAMETAVKELSDLMEERELIDDRREKVNRRIFALRDVIFGLSTLAGEDPYTMRPELFPDTIPPDTGLTDAVIEVMGSLGNYVSTVDIRDTLQARGFNVKRYRNVLSAIHQILRRLVDAGKVEKHEDEEKKLYRLKKQSAGIRVPGSTGGAGIRRGNGPDPQPAGGPTLSRPPRVVLDTDEDPSKSPKITVPPPKVSKVDDEAVRRLRKGLDEAMKKKEGE